MPRPISLDSFVEKAGQFERDGQFGKQVAFALKNGYAITPQSHEQPTKEERDDQVSVVTRTVYTYFNSFIQINKAPKPMYTGRIAKQALRTIRNEKKIGDWKHDVPNELSIRRSTNYAADKDYFGIDRPPLICTFPAWYFPNPHCLDPETRVKLEKAIEAFEKMTPEERRKLKEEQMKIL